MKLGSLFDGSGGFPLSGALCGIEPVWAAEVEPYPIAVTKSRFPKMKHLGSVTDVHGGKIEPVDIITFGSPCQDLSVAGKRAGLKHETEGDEETTRSGLFVEAVRIIKEMRDATNGVYPRFAVWENVPGAFSSNRGEDFRTVLEKLIQVAEPSAVMPDVPKGGWAYADSYRGDGWSIAYRVFDAQYWGVPQRRRRIYLVADFRGECAGEILFKSQGLRGYFAEGRAPWKGIAQNAERGIGADDTENGISYTMVVRSGCDVDSKGKAAGKGALVQTERASTLSTVQDQYLFQPVSYGVTTKGNGDAFISKERHTALTSGGGQAGQGYPCTMQPVTFELGIAQREGGHIYGGVSGTLRANAGDNRMAVAYDGATTAVGFDAYNQAVTGDVAMAMTARSSDAHHVPVVVTDKPVCAVENQPISFQGWAGAEASLCVGHDVAASLVSKKELMVAYPVENHPADSRVNLDESGKVQTLTSRMGTGGGNVPMVMEAIGVDSYNLCTTGKIGRTVTTPSGGLNEHIPLVMEAIGLDRASFNQGKNAQFDFSGTEDGTEPTLTARGPGAVCYCLQDKSIGRKEANSCHGLGVSKETAYTVTGVDRHAVAYETYQKVTGPLMANSHPGSYTGQDAFSDMLVAGKSEPHRYIVRRLTPTECARLQGFPDRWGHPDIKDKFTKEEYEFWLDVRNTHAIINGKTTKQYTKEQMLSWYNKLHTDAAEYKMWGNGIALPTALYVLQGIADVKEGKDEL